MARDLARGYRTAVASSWNPPSLSWRCIFFGHKWQIDKREYVGRAQGTIYCCRNRDHLAGRG